MNNTKRPKLRHRAESEVRTFWVPRESRPLHRAELVAMLGEQWFEELEREENIWIGAAALSAPPTPGAVKSDLQTIAEAFEALGRVSSTARLLFIESFLRWNRQQHLETILSMLGQGELSEVLAEAAQDAVSQVNMRARWGVESRRRSDLLRAVASVAQRAGIKVSRGGRFRDLVDMVCDRVGIDNRAESIDHGIRNLLD